MTWAEPLQTGQPFPRKGLKRLALSLDMVVRLILLRPLPLSVGQSIRTTLLDIDKDDQKEGRCGTQRKEEGETGIIVARRADD